jgi:predicted PurR-regulated permease PerM
MTRYIEFINKNSKFILNLCIIFLCIIIVLYLFLKKEDKAESSQGILKQQFEDTIDNVSQNLSDFADKFLPIRSSLRSSNPLEDSNVVSNQAQVVIDETPSFDLGEFLSNPTVEEILYKAVLAVLLTYLIVSYILRKR